MKIRIGRFEYSECWDGVFYKKLSRYPEITDWEKQNVLDFMRYESANGRNCEIEALPSIVDELERYKSVYMLGKRIPAPDTITECTACPVYHGCKTDLVCHTTSVENARKILECGKLLSAVGARNLPASILKADKRNAANDPEDYFNYVMFQWGNCQAGDRLVMERMLGRFPNEEDLSVGFTPGVRFYFKYETLSLHPQAVFDGVLPVKVKDEVVLEDDLYAAIVPFNEKKRLENAVPDILADRVFYICNDSKDVWEWSRKVYEFVKAI